MEKQTIILTPECKNPEDVRRELLRDADNRGFHFAIVHRDGRFLTVSPTIEPLVGAFMKAADRFGPRFLDGYYIVELRDLVERPK